MGKGTQPAIQDPLQSHTTDLTNAQAALIPLLFLSGLRGCGDKSTSIQIPLHAFINSVTEYL